jgi:hypothetical protein
MDLNHYFILVLLYYKSIVITTNPIPIILQDPDQIARMKFHLQLPTNETVQIKLSFKLLTPSKTLPLYHPEPPENVILRETTPNISAEISSENETTTPLTDLSSETSTLPTELNSTTETPQLVTVEEAIESFRKNIIRKEMEIAGIIESDHPFYRHFRLEYGDNIVIHIRCTYEANYAEQTLTISCYEYRELGMQRILSNGEYENASSLTYTPEYIDARKMNQTYSMTIV